MPVCESASDCARDMQLQLEGVTENESEAWLLKIVGDAASQEERIVVAKTRYLLAVV
jgi:hypothetical protein